MASNNAIDISDLPDPGVAATPDISDLPDPSLDVEPERPPTATEKAGGIPHDILMTDRALMKGLGTVADVPGLLGSLADKAGAHAHDYLYGLFHGGKPDPNTAPTESFQPIGGPAAEEASDVIGLDRPQTKGERIYSGAVSAAAPTIATGGSPVAIAGGLASGGASEAVRQAGGSPLAQTLTGVAAGAGPGLAAAGLGAATRGAIRGSSGAGMQQVIDEAATAGIPISTGQASGSKAIQALEKASANVPGGGALTKLGQQQTETAANRVNGLVDNLNSSGAPLTQQAVGETINSGVKTGMKSMRQQEAAAYSDVDAEVPASTPIQMTETEQKLKDLTTIDPNAPATSSRAIPTRIQQYASDLKSDLSQPSIVQGSLPYSSVSRLRSDLGREIDWGISPADPETNRQLIQVYDSLTKDLNTGASSVGPNAAQAIFKARNLYAANSAKRDILNQVIDKAGGTEAVYTAATSGLKGGATKIGGVMGALDVDSQNIVRASVLNKLGTNTKGDFDPALFFKNYQKMAPEAKGALFGMTGQSGALRTQLDALSNTTGRIAHAQLPQSMGVFGHTGGGVAIYEALKGLLFSHEPVTAGLIGGAYLGNRVLSGALANPQRWASPTPVPQTLAPTLAAQATRQGNNNGNSQ